MSTSTHFYFLDLRLLPAYEMSTEQTLVIFLVTIISHFIGSTYASGDLYPAGLLAFENVVQISHILKKSSKNLTWSQGGVWGRGMTGMETTPSGLPLQCRKSAAEPWGF